MAIHYYCRHCQQNVGSIESTVDKAELGFDKLTNDERQEMIAHDSQGHVHVRTICEDCERTLEQNPSYHEQEAFLH